MSAEYQRPSASPDALRLHLNERTDGCSLRALEAIRSLSPADIGRYPDYDAAIDAAAAYFALPASQLVLTNGLDEGLLAAAIVALRGRANGEAIVIDPAFEMYDIVTAAAGGRVVRVPPGPDLAPDVERLLAAVTPRTRLIFINTPANPTGLEVPAHAVFRVVSEAPGALVFVDEAYAEFGSGSLLDAAARLDAMPNVVVGRTFAKAYGLAGLRIGALVGAARPIAALRAVVPPYSLNAAAAAALVAALADTAHIDDYIDEVRRSRALLYAACDRAGLGYWPSAGNFVLIRAGADAPRLLAAFAVRGISVRDRSGDAGCAGCIRVTAGRLDDTRRAAAAIEEAMCGEP